jgi:hypothetical protein
LLRYSHIEDHRFDDLHVIHVELLAEQVPPHPSMVEDVGPVRPKPPEGGVST